MAVQTNTIRITGGTLTVDAQGDGLDANGSIVMTGGTVLVHGPTVNNNAPLDYDGTFEMSGGVLIAAGSSGMAQTTSTQSAQPGLMMTYSKAQPAGTLVQLTDSKGEALVRFTPSKAYQSVFISTPQLKVGETYTLHAGGTVAGTASRGLYEEGAATGSQEIVTFELASQVTWVTESGVVEGRTGGFGGQGGFGGPGGGPDRFGGGAPGDRPDGEGGTPGGMRGGGMSGERGGQQQAERKPGTAGTDSAQQ